MTDERKRQLLHALLSEPLIIMRVRTVSLNQLSPITNQLKLNYNLHDALLTDIPYESFHIQVPHLVEKFHISSDLFFMSRAVNSGLIINNNGLIAVGNHAVWTAG